MITLGLPLLFPRIFTKDFLHFTPPPESQVLRRRSQVDDEPLEPIPQSCVGVETSFKVRKNWSFLHARGTQRRNIPLGYPHFPSENPILKRAKETLAEKDKKLLHLLELEDSEVYGFVVQNSTLDCLHNFSTYSNMCHIRWDCMRGICLETCWA